MSMNIEPENVCWLSEPPDSGQIKLYLQVAEETNITVEDLKNSLRKLLEEMDANFPDQSVCITPAKVNPYPPGPLNNCSLRRLTPVELLEEE